MNAHEGTPNAIEAATEALAPAPNNAATLGLAALELVPYVGGFVASLISERYARRQGERLYEFATAMKDGLEDLGSQVNVDYVQSEDFEDLFVQTLKRTVDTRSQIKREAYRKLLLNAATGTLTAHAEERMLGTLDRLTDAHMQVLACFVSDAQIARRLGAMAPPGGTSLIDTLRSLCPGLTPDEITQLIFELDREGLTNRVAQSLTTMMTPHGARQLENRVSKYGREFLDFLMQ